MMVLKEIILKYTLEKSSVKQDPIKREKKKLKKHEQKQKRGPSKHPSVKRERFKKKRIKLMQEFSEQQEALYGQLMSEHNCIRRNKKCYSKEEAELYIRHHKKMTLDKYYCKKCKTWHLTSNITSN